MKNDYLINEKPLKALLIFSLPIMLGNFFQQFYTMFDQIVVGQFEGELAQAAVGASYALTNVFICVAIGGGIGASVIISRCFGAHRYREMKTCINTAMIAFFALSVVLGVFGWSACGWLSEVLQTPADIIDDCVGYLKIYFIGLPLLFMYNVLSTLFNSLGKSRIPLYFLIFSSLLNIGLDYWFVGGCGWGIDGAAWATIIAQGVSVALSLVVFLVLIRKFPSDKPRIFDAGQLGQMAKIALPSVLQMSTVSIGMLLVQSVVNSFGAQTLAGFSAAMRIESVCVVPFAAMGNALSSYVAQNIGAGRQDRVRQGFVAATLCVVACAVVVCIVVESCNAQIIGLFSESTSDEAMATGTGYLGFMGWFFVLLGFKMTLDGVLRGAGDMVVFTLSNLVNLTIRVVLAVTLAPRYGIQYVWMAVPIGWFVNGLLAFIQFMRGKWKTKYTQ